MEITPEDLANLRARDERWQHIHLAQRVEAEISGSLIVNLVIEAATRKAEYAKEQLVSVNPADTDAIIALQADAKCAKLIGETLGIVKNNAENAYSAVRAEERISLDTRTD